MVSTPNAANNAANNAASPSAAVYARVQRVMESQNTGVVKLNAALARDQTRLSALGQLSSALSGLETVARAMGGAGASSSHAGVKNLSQGMAAPLAQDSGKLAANIGTLVGAYNNLNAQLKSLQQGDMKSDLALGQVSGQMTQLLQAGATSLAALAGAGLSIARNGDLQIDALKLDSALRADPGAVAKLLTNNGKGIADQLVARIALLTGDSGAISRETATTGADLAALNGKKAALGKALTAQATALAKQYSQQEQAAANGAGTSLFDFNV